MGVCLTGGIILKYDEFYLISDDELVVRVRGDIVHNICGWVGTPIQRCTTFGNGSYKGGAIPNFKWKDSLAAALANLLLLLTFIILLTKLHALRIMKFEKFWLVLTSRTVNYYSQWRSFQIPPPQIRFRSTMIQQPNAISHALRNTEYRILRMVKDLYIPGIHIETLNDSSEQWRNQDSPDLKILHKAEFHSSICRDARFR